MVRAPSGALQSPVRGAWILFALLAAVGCASGGRDARSNGQDEPGSAHHKTGRPVEVRLRDYKSGAVFGLVNESHTDRTELYSKQRALEDASTKVTTDEVLDEVVAYFRQQGFFERAAAGPAPATAPSGKALEVCLPEVRFHALLQASTSAADAQCLKACMKAFLEIYNSTVQLQSVDRPPDWNDKRPGPPAVKGG